MRNLTNVNFKCMYVACVCNPPTLDALTSKLQSCLKRKCECCRSSRNLILNVSSQILITILYLERKPDQNQKTLYDMLMTYCRSKSFQEPCYKQLLKINSNFIKMDRKEKSSNKLLNTCGKSGFTLFALQQFEKVFTNKKSFTTK